MTAATMDIKACHLPEDTISVNNLDQDCTNKGNIFDKLEFLGRKIFGSKDASPVMTKNCNLCHRNSVTIDLCNRLRLLDDFRVYEENSACMKICDELGEILSCEGNDDEQEKCKLQVPSDLPSRIVKDVLSMSEYEPCGIRGCVLLVNMKEKSTCRPIGEIECDPSTVPTFQLNLTLAEDTRPWIMFKRILNSFKQKIAHETCYPTKVLCKAFQLSKTKLYRSN